MLIEKVENLRAEAEDVMEELKVWSYTDTLTYNKTSEIYYNNL